MSPTLFTFDDEVVTSHAYRRAFLKAHKNTTTVEEAHDTKADVAHQPFIRGINFMNKPKTWANPCQVQRTLVDFPHAIAPAMLQGKP